MFNHPQPQEFGVLQDYMWTLEGFVGVRYNATEKEHFVYLNVAGPADIYKSSIF